MTITGTADRIEVRRPGEGGSAGERRRYAGEIGAHVGADVEVSDETQARAEVEASNEAQARPEVEASDESQRRAEVEASDETQARAEVEASDEFQPRAEVERRARVEADAHGKSSREMRSRGCIEPTVRDDAGGREEPASLLDVAVRRAQAKDALVGLGWKPAIASAAVAAACATLPHAPLETLIFEALRRCPRSCTTAAHAAQAP